MVNKPALFVVDKLEILRAVELTPYKELHLRSVLFATKGVCEGASVGLGIVQRIVADHESESRADSMSTKTTFRTRVPVDRPRREPSNDDDGGVNVWT